MVSRLPQQRRLVDGFVLPVRLGGHVALDFCNTLAGWGDREQIEYLTSYDHLLTWAQDAGVAGAVTAKRDPAAAAGVLMRARALREALHAACTDPSATGAWDLVAAEARAAAAVSRLDPAAPAGARWVVSSTAGLEVPLLAVAAVAGEFLATADLTAVHSCLGTQCGWLFVDPRGRRRWCSMAVCGNRAKARRHAARLRESRS